MPESADAHDVFISHSHFDTPFCLELAAGLRAAGVTVWLDEDSMTLSDTIPGNVSRQIARCSALIVTLSSAAVDSQWVKLETDTAIALHKNVVVVMTEPIGQLPDSLALLAAYKHFPMWEAALADCIRHIAQLFPHAGASVQRSVAQWQAHTGPALDVDWSPDGKSLATVGVDGVLRIWRQQAPGQWSAQTVLDEPRDWLTHVRWSRGGTTIGAICADNSLWIWRPDVGRHRRIELPRWEVLALGWSGTRIEMLTTGGQATFETRDEGQLHLDPVDPAASCPIIATISPTATSVASYFGDGELMLTDGRVQRTITLNVDAVRAFVWNRRGTSLALLASGGQIRIFGVGHEASDRSLDTARNRTVRIAWVSEDLLLTGDSDGVLRTYHLPSHDAAHELGTGPGSVAALSTAPDAKLVAVMHETGMASLWAVDRGENPEHGIGIPS